MKIAIIVFGIDKALEFEWLISEIDTSRFELSFISINNKEETSLKKHCQFNDAPFFHINYTRKKDMIGAILKTRRIIKKINPQIVHSHIFEGGLIGVTAAWLARIKHRIYTRHYSDFHHVYFPNGLKYDKWINAKATHIIAVSEVVKSILVEKENISKKKVSVIHHGIKIDNEETFENSRMTNVKAKHGICSKKIIVGVVSRYTKLKGLQYIIPAFKDLQKENSNLHLVLANAQGDFQPEVARLLKELPKETYTEILFENDNEALFKSFDVFVHVPISQQAEAFGLTYIEALKFGVPSVFTLSGIANEIVKDEENALVVNYKNTSDITKAIERILSHESLRLKLTVNGKKSIETFTTIKKTKALEELYQRISF
ncbi:MAG: glycosyltransferase family 4 protein [Brumimicrobium sp.]